MDYLPTDAILLKIYHERGTISKFMETVFNFLLRNTNFRLMDGPNRTRLRHSMVDTLSIYELELQKTLKKEYSSTDNAPPAAAEIEVETETLNSEANSGTNYFNSKIDEEQPIYSLYQVNLGLIHPVINGPETQTTSSKNDFKKIQKILPKEQYLSDKTIPELKTKTKRFYKCAECSEIFLSFRQLKVHEALHTSQATDGVISVCFYCCSLYANTETLDKHINECHENGRYLCIPCAKTYKSRGQLLKHVHSSVHNASSLLYYCSLCPRSGETYIEFATRSDLQQHYQEMHLLMPASQDEDDVEIEMNEEFLDEFLLNNVNDNSFNFSECWDALDLNLPDMLRLTNTDVDSSHGAICDSAQIRETLFKCPKCCDGHSSQKKLLQHLAYKHRLPVLICNKCDSSFADYAQWIHHKSTHRSSFVTKANAKQNLYQCEICDKNLRSTTALDYHVKTHLRSFLLAPHECPYCRKRFHNDTNFKQHIRIVHSQTKRHTCELCDKPFATLDHLKKHVLSQHQNERKHICHMCEKSFTQLCHLKQHLAIHTTGKTHKCLKCDEKFWRNIDLQRHMLKKHA